jgi:hypothetical protein
MPDEQRRHQRHRHPQQVGPEHDGVGLVGARQLLDLDRHQRAHHRRGDRATRLPVVNACDPGARSPARRRSPAPPRPAAHAHVFAQPQRRGDGDEHRRGVRQRDRLRQRQVADRPEAASIDRCRSAQRTKVARQLVGAHVRGELRPGRAAAAAARQHRQQGRRRHCGRTRLRRWAGLRGQADAQRHQARTRRCWPASAMRRGSCSVRCARAAHHGRADDARLGFDGDAEAILHRCGDPRARSSSCRPVAWPWLTSTSACSAETPASPSRWPFQPHWSISQAADSLRVSSPAPRNTGIAGCVGLQCLGLAIGTIGFLKKLPALPNRAGSAACAADADHRLGHLRGARRAVDAHCRSSSRMPAYSRRRSGVRDSTNSTAVTM